ncbi:MAG: hypothetical protein ACRDRV_13525 [Pseudonocardiaceae bacterium]
MYEVRVHDAARATVDLLPANALAGYLDVLDLLELKPWSGPPFREDKPDGNIRTLTFGPGGLVVYMILDAAQEVHLLEVQWAG